MHEKRESHPVKGENPKAIYTKIVKFLLVIFVSCLFIPQLFAQRPAGAYSWSYIPHLVSGPGGGTATDPYHWVTDIIIDNPHAIMPVNATVWFIDGNGGDLSLPFESRGSSSTYSLDIAPFGSARLVGAIHNNPTKVGYVLVIADGPVLAAGTFRLTQGGKTVYSITTPATLPTGSHRYPVKAGSGVAIVNPNGGETPRTIEIQAHNLDGTSAGNSTVTIPPQGHTSFLVRQVVNGLPDNFKGSIYLRAPYAWQTFVAMVLEENDGTLSSLPDGSIPWPPDRFILAHNVFSEVMQAMRLLDSNGSLGFNNIDDVDFNIEFSDEFNAYGGCDGITMHSPLLELLSDRSELAFVIGHELGHVYQCRSNGWSNWRNLKFNRNRELDADSWGMLLGLFSGHDVYSIAGALSKMHMVMGAASVDSQSASHNRYLEEKLTAGGLLTVHGSFNTRMDEIYGLVIGMCAVDSGAKALCDGYRSIFHPSFPDRLFSPVDGVPAYRDRGVVPGEVDLPVGN